MREAYGYIEGHVKYMHLCQQNKADKGGYDGRALPPGLAVKGKKQDQDHCHLRTLGGRNAQTGAKGSGAKLEYGKAQPGSGEEWRFFSLRYRRKIKNGLCSEPCCTTSRRGIQAYRPPNHTGLADQRNADRLVAAGCG